MREPELPEAGRGDEIARLRTALEVSLSQRDAAWAQIEEMRHSLSWRATWWLRRFKPSRRS